MPSGQPFAALPFGGLALFKLKSPVNAIAGGGFFLRYDRSPLSLAWKAFEQKNGAASEAEFRRLISPHLDERGAQEPVIGCLILAQPFFWEQEDWIKVPENFSQNIVRFKGYDANSEEGKALIDQVRARLQRSLVMADAFQSEPSDIQRYGNPLMVLPRLGQGSFRMSVTEAYGRRCAVTGERTLPVLEAAHIQSYSAQGPHAVQNGLLLRSDIHTLFDRGYVTVTEDLHLKVSRRIRQEFDNGKEYYALDEKVLKNLPANPGSAPSREFLKWHNQSVFRE